MGTSLVRKVVTTLISGLSSRFRLLFAPLRKGCYVGCWKIEEGTIYIYTSLLYIYEHSIYNMKKLFIYMDGCT